MKPSTRTKDALDEAERGGITIRELRAALSHEIAVNYHNDRHSSLAGSPLDAWNAGVARCGQPRRWPDDPAARLRLRHLLLLDGGTRKREGGHYRFERRNYIPLRPGYPELARVLYDPDHPEVVAIYSADGGRMSGCYVGDAIASGREFSSPLPVRGDEDSPALATATKKKRKKGGLKTAAKKQRRADVAEQQTALAQPEQRVETRAPIALKRREFVS